MKANIKVSDTAFPKFDQSIEEYFEYISASYRRGDRNMKLLGEVNIYLMFLGNILGILLVLEKASAMSQLELAALNNSIKDVGIEDKLTNVYKGLLKPPFQSQEFALIGDMISRSKIEGTTCILVLNLKYLNWSLFMAGS